MVQIWNLDELDPVESVCVLGLESTSSSLQELDDSNNKKTNNKKKKKKKKYDRNKKESRPPVSPHHQHLMSEYSIVTESVRES